MTVVDHLIGGVVTAPATGERFESVDPHDGTVLAEVAAGGAEDARAAVTAARRAFDEGTWPALASAERRRLLHAFADLVDREAAELALLDVRDMGKPIREATGFDLPRVSKNLRFFADLADLAGSEAYPDAGQLSYVLHPPAGVVAAISPWNFPAMQASWKVAPALAFGNTVVLKPAEQSPLSAARLGALALEAGLPAGVLNVLQGFGPGAAGEALTRDPRVDRITFTGESATGRTIMATAAANLTPVSFELGGKSANVVFADCELDDAVDGAIRAIFTNNGEVCLAGSRLLVQREILDEFTARFVAAARRLRVGDPKDPETEIGPLVEARHRAKVEAYVRLGLEEGGELLCGGGRPEDDGLPAAGHYFAPTVLGGVRNDMRVAREEIFGPVQVVVPFDDEEDALALANDSEYGLAGMLWTNDLDRAHRLVERWRAGMVWVNCFFERDLRLPFGGERASGIGREGGLYSREFFTDPRAVVIRRRPAPCAWAAEHSVETTATPEAVWRQWADVARWPEWNADIERIELDGPFAAGSRVTMTPIGREPVSLRLAEVDEPVLFVDEAGFDGLVVRTSHRAERLDDGRTRVTYRMEITGAQAGRFGPQLGPEISGDFPQVLAALAARAES